MGIFSIVITVPKPDWLKVRPPAGEGFLRLKSLLKELNLHTVCEEARCPNVAECWGGGTATIMLMGDTCTRGCRFCAVSSGNPQGHLDPLEPLKVARAVSELSFRYVVLTSVDRDDLPDGGADHFARTVEAIKRANPEVLVEVLIPDFQGDPDSLERIVDADPDVVAHNLETVRRLTPGVRDRRATYDQSLRVLGALKRLGAPFTKSSLMLGLGETQEEVWTAMHDLRGVDVDILTLGQYLRPSSWHLEVEEYVHPATFDALAAEGRRAGFLYVAAGPLVRSSYRAGELFMENLVREGRKYEGHNARGMATLG